MAGQHAADGSNQGFVSATPADRFIVYSIYLQPPSVSSFYEGGAGTYLRLNDADALDQPALGVPPLRDTLGLRWEPHDGHLYVQSTLNATAE